MGQKYFTVKKNKLPNLFLFLGMAALLSCNAPSIYEEEKSIAKDGWAYRDTLDFRFAMTDTSQRYNIYLDFDHAEDFGSQNIYLRLHTRFPDGKRVAKVFPVDFYDAQGQCFGQCSGGQCHLRAVLQENAFFNQTGEYTITVEQYMRQDPLLGVSKLGLIVVKK